MLASLRMRRDSAQVEQAELQVDGDILPLILKRHRQARRMILRLDRRGTAIVLTMPYRASRKSAFEFARAHAGWIRSRLESEPERTPFADGSIIPLRGKAHVIRLREGRRGTVRVTAPIEEAPGLIEVAGESVHLRRRLTDWLKAECKRDLVAASLAYAKVMEVTVRKVTVRDQASRWGSCSASGRLSFSWRLILAPRFVLDYVAAHEVAHLVHMNHGARFWALVAKHCEDFQSARSWIRRYGKKLHSYGT
jgi:predicted metal-dependent hydrolase